MKNIVYISLGSNIGDRIGNMKKALALLEKKGCLVKKLSSFYLTEPMYYSAQPYFINAAAKIETELKPESFLKLIGETENKLKRRRTISKGPRTLDLDILFFNREIVHSENLQIPHPLLHERAFVLAPLSEIAADYEDPLRNKTISGLRSLVNIKDTLKIPVSQEEMENFVFKLPPRSENEYTADYTKKTLKALSFPQKKMGKIFHVAGSEGKTTLSGFLAGALYRGGFKTGLYTSPHIECFRERIKINGKEISPADFLKAGLEIISKAPVRLSFFEFMTCAAFLHFARHKTRFAVIEAGLGGKNDATNAATGNYCIFTPISEEHRCILGRDVREITLNKSGIIKKKSRVFISPQNGAEIEKIIKNSTRAAGAFFCRLPGASFLPAGLVSDISEISGPASYLNFKFAVLILKKLGLPYRNLFSRPFLIKQIPPCRREIMKFGKKKIILDGAHTPSSMELFLSSIPDGACFVVSFMKDKKIAELSALLEKKPGRIIITESSSYRSEKAEKILSFFSKTKKAETIKDSVKALKKALRLEAPAVITGSLYLCADLRAYMLGKKAVHPKEMIEKKQANF